MIIHVPVNGRFAWYETTRDEFILFGNVQTFTSWKDFVACATGYCLTDFRKAFPCPTEIIDAINAMYPTGDAIGYLDSKGIKSTKVLEILNQTDHGDITLPEGHMLVTAAHRIMYPTAPKDAKLWGGPHIRWLESNLVGKPWNPSAIYCVRKS